MVHMHTPPPPALQKKRRALDVVCGRSSSISTSVLPGGTVVDTWHTIASVNGLYAAGRDGTRPSKENGKL